MSSQGELKIQLPADRSELRLEVYVRFGNPKYDDCRNFGICKMELASNKSSFYRKKKRCSKAILVRQKEEMWIYFLKESMTKKTRTFYFGESKFLIEKAKVVDGEIALRLNECSLVFNVGWYPVMKTEKYFIVKMIS